MQRYVDTAPGKPPFGAGLSGVQLIARAIAITQHHHKSEPIAPAIRPNPGGKARPIKARLPGCMCAFIRPTPRSILIMG